MSTKSSRSNEHEGGDQQSNAADPSQFLNTDAFAPGPIVGSSSRSTENDSSDEIKPAAEAPEAGSAPTISKSAAKQAEVADSAVLQS